MEIKRIILILKEKQALIWLIFILLFFILLIFSLWLFLKKIEQDSEKFFLGKTKIALLEKQSVEIEDFKRNYNDYLPNLQKLDQMFIDQQNPLNFIRFLEESAFTSSVDLEISPLSYSQEQGQKIVSLQLSCRGNFPNVLIFLNKIEKGPYLLSVQSLIISQTKTKITQAKFSIKVLTK